MNQQIALTKVNNLYSIRESIVTDIETARFLQDVQTLEKALKDYVEIKDKISKLEKFLIELERSI